MATAITPEQMKALETHPRHRSICTQWIRDIATFLRQTPTGDVTWAQKRIIAAAIALHPNTQDYTEWVTQMTATQKGAEIWDGADEGITEENLNATIDFLASNGGAKYDEMANIIYTLRAAQVEF